MGITTKIEWADSTVNPTRGCDGCELWNQNDGGTCYAAALHNRFTPGYAYPQLFHVVEPVPGRMRAAAEWPNLGNEARPDKPWLDGYPRVIFVGDMGDILSAAIHDDYIRREIIDTIDSPAGRQHLWVILTKRPKRFATWAKRYGYNAQTRRLPANLVAMTSVTNQGTAQRIGELAAIPTRYHGVSIEPILGPVDLLRPPFLRDQGDLTTHILDWIIVGGESGPKARPPHPDWIRKLRDQSRAARVPFFFKQWGEWSPYPQAGNVNFRTVEPDSYVMQRAGKQRAGRTLDGATFTEMPQLVKLQGAT